MSLAKIARAAYRRGWFDASVDHLDRTTTDSPAIDARGLERVHATGLEGPELALVEDEYRAGYAESIASREAPAVSVPAVVAPSREFGVLLSHAPDGEVAGPYDTWQEAGEYASKVCRAQPGIESVLMIRDANAEWRAYAASVRLRVLAPIALQRELWG